MKLGPSMASSLILSPLCLTPPPPTLPSPSPLLAVPAPISCPWFWCPGCWFSCSPMLPCSVGLWLLAVLFYGWWFHALGRGGAVLDWGVGGGGPCLLGLSLSFPLSAGLLHDAADLHPVLARPL